jgi:uncharacterized membrane protein (UPF0127 family)
MIYVKTSRPPGAAVRRRVVGRVGGLVAACVLSAAGAQSVPQPKLPVVVLTAGMHRVEAEVADTMLQQMIGLMQRRTMAQHEGMLFVYEEAQKHCFWMRNTPLPLSIAFIDDAGRIVNIEDMQPQTDESHCAAKPVRFALEMNQGWFAKRGLKPGARFKGPFFRH